MSSIARVLSSLALVFILSFVTARAHAQPAIDAKVWGPYATLADTTRRSSLYEVRWYWSRPGEELIEEFRRTKSGKLIVTYVITPGDAPGQLKQSNSVLNKNWTGTFQSDGSVLWIASGMLKMSYRTAMAADGAAEIVPVKVRDGQIVSVSPATPEARFVLTTDSTVATTPTVATAPAPEAAPVTPVATAPQVLAAAPPSPAAADAAAPAVAATPAVAAPAQAAPAANFGWLEKRVGRSFVGNNASGPAYTLDVYREGDALALHLGTLGGGKGGRMLIRPSAVPGGFELLETWHASASSDKRSAYFAGAAAQQTDPLDGYYADPRKPGDLVLGYDISGGYIVLVFQPDNANGGLSYYQHGGKRRFGIRSAIGNLDYVDTAWFSPDTQQAVAQAQAYGQAQQQRREEQRLEDERDRAEQQSRAQSALYQSLVQANEVASANEARSRAVLDATLDQAARQAAAEREQRTAGSTHSAQDVRQAREATERQLAIARQHEAQQQSQAQAAAQSEAPRSTANVAEAIAPGKPLRFVLSIGLLNKPGDTVNPTCYSNVITRPGPPGWGARGFLPPGSGEQARETVQSFKARFIALCRQSGRDITSEGNFHWTWNELQDGDQQIANTRARYPEDVSVTLD